MTESEMHLCELRLRNFRNYEEQDLLPASGLNLLEGENAQGKSNLLESIYLLATTRSVRASRESELIRQGAEMASVFASLSREREGDTELEIQVYQTDKKSVRVNGARRPRVVELLGQLNAVHFAASDLSLVNGEPSVRRRYLNIEISQISPKYVFDLASYKKALEQRNRLLRDLKDRPFDRGWLEAWNEQIVQHGAPLIEKRRFFLERLAPLADEIHRELTDERESLMIEYQPSIPLPSDSQSGTADSFRTEIERCGGEEIRRGLTLVGPQRDEVAFRINGLDARSFGSQGQQRTAVLSVKLAQFRLMTDYVGEPPLMLLDDVLSDLDDRRRAHLLKWIRGRCQTFLTCTTLRDLPEEMRAEARIFDVEGGQATPRAEETPAPAATNGHSARRRGRTVTNVQAEEGAAR